MFGQLDKLTFLSLRENEINSIDLEAFVGLNSLKVLRLRNNQLMSVNQTCFAIFGKLKTIEAIELSENRFESKAESFFKNSNSDIRKYLNLSDPYLNDWNKFLDQFSQSNSPVLTLLPPQSPSLSHSLNSLNSSPHLSINQPDWIQFMFDPFKERYIGDVFMVKRPIGTGAYGEVYLVRDSRDQKERALKKTDYDKKNSKNERKLLKMLQHENVVEFVEFFLIWPLRSNEITHMCIITEFCEVFFLSIQFIKDFRGKFNKI